jgi:hypothetical protein
MPRAVTPRSRCSITSCPCSATANFTTLCAANSRVRIYVDFPRWPFIETETETSLSDSARLPESESRGEGFAKRVHEVARGSRLSCAGTNLRIRACLPTGFSNSGQIYMAKAVTLFFELYEEQVTIFNDIHAKLQRALDPSGCCPRLVPGPSLFSLANYAQIRGGSWEATRAGARRCASLLFSHSARSRESAWKMRGRSSRSFASATPQPIRLRLCPVC